MCGHALSFGILVAVPVFWGKLGTVPSCHLTLRAGLGQPQAVFLHVGHGWEIKVRGVERGVSTSLESAILFSSPRTDWTFCCPGICPAQASSWRNEQLSLKVISNTDWMTYTTSYRARILVPWVLRLQTAAVQVSLTAFPCSSPAYYFHCHYKNSFYLLCFQHFHYIQSLLLHGKFRILWIQNLIDH